MKRIVITLALTLLLAMPSFAGRVTQPTALKAGQAFLSAKGLRSATLNDVSDAIGCSNLYVFTSDQAFIVMAADDRVAPVLGYSLRQGFSVEEIPDNVQWWLRGYNTQIQYAIDRGGEPTQAIAKQWSDLIRGTVPPQEQRSWVNPLIYTTWNQNYPYNSFCPVDAAGPGGHAYAGCVANGMAQIIKYYFYPSHGIGSHSFNHTTYGNQAAIFGEAYYNLGIMPVSLTSSSTQNQINAVAMLMYQCGVSVDMSYGPTVSAASVYKIPSALVNYFGFSQSAAYVAREDYTDGAWINMIQHELNLSRPILYGGYSDSQSVGHRFICDGYDTDTYGAFYFHFNWGWGGNHDGYFSIDNMTPGNADFSFFQNAIVGIEPSTNTAIPSTPTYTLNGDALTLNWTAPTGPSSFNVYKDYELLGNTSATSFTVPHACGAHRYYVRSVNADGEMSLSSEILDVNVPYPTPLVNDLQAQVSDNNVTLSWSAPAWCYPTTPTATLSYGDGPATQTWGAVCYGHRYPAEGLTTYVGKSVYKVETYIHYPGDYTLYVYTDTWSGIPDSEALALVMHRYISNPGWHEFVFPQPVILSSAKDLWAVFKVENTGQSYPAVSMPLNTYNANACYAGVNWPENIYAQPYNISWLIRTCLSDGAYTYNLYRNGVSVANNLTGTSFVDNGLALGSYDYTLKTNYYAGQTGNSNTVNVQITVDNVDEEEDATLMIYPQPFDDRLVVKSMYDIRRCEIYSATGQCVLSLSDCSREFEIALPQLPSGCYLIQLTSDVSVETRRLVKK